tara:strand:- start:689 stop:862 length:174 start_codon:yes stop_codon:yes gene_type:complete
MLIRQLKNRKVFFLYFFYALSNWGDAWYFWPFFLVMENPRPTAFGKGKRAENLNQFI